VSRQYFEDVLVDPPLADLTAVTATAETGLWLPALYTPVPAFGQNGPTAGKIYRVTAGGILSTAGSGTLTITPRYGLTTAGVTLGASVAQTVPINLTAVPWALEFTLVFRAIGVTASTSTCVGTGFFASAGTAATAGSAFQLAFGGTTVTTADTTINNGIFIGWTLSVAGSVTPKYAFIQALN
jgi:hypothetical protein